MKTIQHIMPLLSVCILASCVAMGPDGRPIERDPLPLAAVAGVYEGTSAFFYHRLELYPDGTGMLAALLQDGEREPQIETVPIVSWKTTAGGITGTVRVSTVPGKADKAVTFEGVFVAGQLHIGSCDEDRSKEDLLHLMREADVNTSRDVLKQAIIKAKKEQDATVLPAGGEDEDEHEDDEAEKE